MTQKYIGRLYIYFGKVGKLEDKYDPVWKDNGFDGRVGKLIGYNYCRLFPSIRFHKFGIDIGFLVFNFTLSYQ